ncbi:ankycorbin-like [Rhopilema esculentum]|uniref:ankycorbin-like n=1 Tax=Rhopilema esculentum TaxID=499914 RepID=UPI0031D2EAF6
MFSKYLHRSTASTNPDGLNVWSLPTLHRAAYKNKIDKLISLLNKRQNGIDKKDNVGRTALHYGCLAGSVQVVQLILDRKGKIIADNLGQSPVFMAIGNGHLEIVKIFYGIKFDFNKADNNGTTPLHLAIFKKNVTIVEFLVKQVNVNVDASDMQLTTPLHQAIRADIPMVVLLLVEKGAKTEIRDKIGKTPLMMACVKGQEQCVEILLKNKANIYRKEVQIESHSEAQKNSKGSGSIPDKPLDSGLGMLSSSGQMTRSNQLCNAASIEAPEFVKMQFSAETQSSVELDTTISKHQQKILSAEVTSSLANNTVPYPKEPTSQNQPVAQRDQDVPEFSSNDIVVTFSGCSIESLSSVESETAVSHHQPAILPAKVTSSMVKNIVPNTKEPTATADIDTLSPDQPMAQLNKDVPELGSNDIVVSFSECSIESLSSVESETPVSHHQPAILPAKVTSSMVNNIVPNTKEPTATADIDTLSPDQPMAQLNKDVPELGSNDIVVSFVRKCAAHKSLNSKIRHLVSCSRRSN